MSVCSGQKKVVLITRWVYKRDGRKAGPHFSDVLPCATPCYPPRFPGRVFATFPVHSPWVPPCSFSYATPWATVRSLWFLSYIFSSLLWVPQCLSCPTLCAQKDHSMCSCSRRESMRVMNKALKSAHLSINQSILIQTHTNINFTVLEKEK